MWKTKLGSSGTYIKLIEVLESAGYITYADNVRKIVLESHREIEAYTGRFSYIIITT